MPHPIRVYCPGPTLPTVARLQAFAAERGRPLAPYEEYAEDDPAAPTWCSIGLTWRRDRSPLFIEIERFEGPDGRLLRQEQRAVRERLAALPAGARREEALRRVRALRFVAGVVLPGEGLDDAGWQAVDALVACFEQDAQGVAWIAGRGFYLDGQALGGA